MGLNIVDNWFRQLDQRRIHQNAREWLVQVTSIHQDDDVLWIQIADDSDWSGSVLLRVYDTTPVEQAVGALSSRAVDGWCSYPKVVTAFLC